MSSDVSLPPGALDWLIVGGGPQGLHMALVLLGKGHVAPGGLGILDPWPSLLWRWKEMTSNCGMDFLRSGSVHHSGLEATDLRKFARAHGNEAWCRFTEPYLRPSRELFQRFQDQLVLDYGLEALHIPHRALGLQFLGAQGRQSAASPPGAHGMNANSASANWQVQTEAGPLQSRNVVLALGLGDRPLVPSWARDFHQKGLLPHVLDPGFSLDNWSRSLEAGARVLVVGGGISGVQAGLGLLERGVASLTVLDREAQSIHQWDSDPAWIGPRNLRAFSAEPDPGRRRELIAQARHKGSLPADLARVWDDFRVQGRGRNLQGEIHSVQQGPEGGWVVEGQESGGGQFRQSYQGLLLATGAQAEPPGWDWLGPLAGELNLALAPDGYPWPSENLEWAPGLYLMGPLAELRVGPGARNLSGARRAAALILEGACQKTTLILDGRPE